MKKAHRPAFFSHDRRDRDPLARHDVETHLRATVGPLEFQTARKQDASNVVIASVSEAIHAATRKNGLLRRFAPLRKRFAFVAGNDVEIQFRDLAARFARVISLNLPPSPIRGRGECRAPDGRVCNVIG